MNLDPKTRASLILRLGDPSDDLAWTEFLQVYEPLLLRLATRWGLQRADALEVVQETLLAVAKSIPKYKQANHPGAFRAWLASITRNKLADLLACRRRQVHGSGDSSVRQWLDQQASPTTNESLWDWNQKQQIFRWAAQRVQSQVKPVTWEAFHRTSVLNEPVATVADALSIREGAVYVARSRVLARLRSTVAQWEMQYDQHNHHGELPHEV